MMNVVRVNRRRLIHPLLNGKTQAVAIKSIDKIATNLFSQHPKGYFSRLTNLLITSLIRVVLNNRLVAKGRAHCCV